MPWLHPANTLSAVKLTLPTAAIAVPIKCSYLGVAAAWAVANFNSVAKPISHHLN